MAMRSGSDVALLAASATSRLAFSGRGNDGVWPLAADGAAGLAPLEARSALAAVPPAGAAAALAWLGAVPSLARGVAAGAAVQASAASSPSSGPSSGPPRRQCARRQGKVRVPPRVLVRSMLSLAP